MPRTSLLIAFASLFLGACGDSGSGPARDPGANGGGASSSGGASLGGASLGGAGVGGAVSEDAAPGDRTSRSDLDARAGSAGTEDTRGAQGIGSDSGKGDGGKGAADAAGLDAGGKADSEGGSLSSDAGSSKDATVTSGTTIVPDPSWACGMVDGIPPPSSGELVFRATLQLGDTHEVGSTPYGRRRVFEVKGGTIKGDRIQATVLTGGFDFELTLSNGATELEQVDMLRASDGALIYLRTCGVAPAGDATVRIVPDFEVATSSSWAWLNTGKFAGTRIVNAAAGTAELEVYDVSKVASGEPRIRLTDPAGVPNQPWDCATVSGAKGASVFSESVTLGSSLSVGASKRGTRNVIPISGGTVTGRFTGKVISGGADYQLVGATTKLDARYVLSSNDGEFVVVRNCGALGALAPLFEARAAGPYAFLNTNNYVSSDPGSAAGGVSITFYERK